MQEKNESKAIEEKRIKALHVQNLSAYVSKSESRYYRCNFK